MLLVVPIVVSFLIGASAWALNRAGAAVPGDRVGAAGFVLGFVFGHHEVVGPGWDTGRAASWLPLIGVASALLLPRIVARYGELPVGVGPRVTMFVAIVGLCAACFLTGRQVAGQLELAVLGAAIGVLASGFLGGARDLRAGTWITVALLAGLVPALAG